MTLLLETMRNSLPKDPTEDLMARLRQSENEIDFLKVKIQDHKDSSARENSDWKRQKKEMTKKLKDLEELCRDKTDFKQQIEDERANVLNLQETVRTLKSELEDKRQESEERRQRVKRLGQKIKDLKIECDFYRRIQRCVIASEEEEGLGIYPFILLVVMLSTFSALLFICCAEAKHAMKIQGLSPREPSNKNSVLGDGPLPTSCDGRRPMASKNETSEITVLAIFADESLFLDKEAASFLAVLPQSTLVSIFKLAKSQSLNSNGIDIPYLHCGRLAAYENCREKQWRELTCERNVPVTRGMCPNADLAHGRV